MFYLSGLALIAFVSACLYMQRNKITYGDLSRWKQTLLWIGLSLSFLWIVDLLR